MNSTEFGELIHAYYLANENVSFQNTTERLLDFLSDPQSIFVIFQYMDEVFKTDNQRDMFFLLTLIRKYMGNKYKDLPPNLQNQIFDKLISYIEINSSEQFTSILAVVLRPMIKNDEKRISSILKILNSISIEDIPSKIDLLLPILSNINKYSPLLIINKSLFIYPLTISSFQNETRYIVSSIRLYFLLKEKNLIDSDEFFSNLISHIDDFYFDAQIWSILNKKASKKLISEEHLKELFDFTLNAASEGNLPFEAFNFFFKYINYIDKIDFNQLMHIFNEFLTQYFEDKVFAASKRSFKEITKYLQNHPIQNIYDLLKQFVDQAEMNSQALSLSYYFIIFKVSWNEFFSDIDSFIEKLLIAINEEQSNTKIFILLEELKSNYLLDDFYSLKFIKEIAKFLLSDYDAFKPIDSMVNQLMSPFPDLLGLLVSLSMDQWDDQFIPILTNLINCDENVDPNLLKKIADTILPVFENSSFFPLAVILMKRNKELIDLLPHSLEVLQKDPKNKIVFINCIYKYFGYLFDPQFESIIKEVQEMIIDNCKRNKFINDTTLLNLCSTFVKYTKDKNLATELEKQCINFLMNYDENANNVEEEEEDYDDDNNNVNNNYNDNQIKSVFYSCKEIIKLLDKVEQKKMLFHINLHINNTNNIEIVEQLLSIIAKLLHHSCDEEKELYLNKCNNLLDKIIKGKLKALNGRDILSFNPSLIKEVGSLIFEVVRYQSPYIETISNFILKVLKTCQNQFYYSSYVSACYYLIENKTGSQKVIQEIVDLIPIMIKDTNLISLKHSIAYLFVPMIQYDEKTFQKLIQFVPILHNWFLDEKKNEYIHYELLSTISLAFLTFFANGMMIDIKLLNESINEFPPIDNKDTSSMINNIIKIFSSNKLDSSCIQNAAFALSKLFLLDNYDLEKKKVSKELMDSAHKLFISFSNSNPEIWLFLNEKYKNSEEKINKLKKICIIIK